VIDYSIGTGKGMRDKAGVTFAGAFYRALGFGRSIRSSFESAKAELGLIKIPYTKGIELFVRHGVTEGDPFPGLRRRLSKTTGEARRQARQLYDVDQDDLRRINLPHGESSLTTRSSGGFQASTMNTNSIFSSTSVGNRAASRILLPDDGGVS
jgi:hypothetical protein